MRAARTIFFLIGLLSAGSLLAQSTDDQMEFDIIKEALESRYRDFYVHLNDLDRRETEASKFAEEQRKARKLNEEQLEKDRLAYIKERRAEPEMDPSAYEKELEAQNRDYLLRQKQYVERRNKLRDFEKRMGMVPEDIEYELYDFPEDEADAGSD